MVRSVYPVRLSIVSESRESDSSETEIEVPIPAEDVQ